MSIYFLLPYLQNLQDLDKGDMEEIENFFKKVKQSKTDTNNKIKTVKKFLTKKHRLTDLDILFLLMSICRVQHLTTSIKEALKNTDKLINALLVYAYSN